MPLFSLESRLTRLGDSQTERKYLSLLVKVARTYTMLDYNDHCDVPSCKKLALSNEQKFSRSIRQRLLEILESRR